MSGEEVRRLEERLTSALHELAPVPSGDLLDRTLNAVAGTPQFDPAHRLRGGWPSVLRTTAAATVVVAGLVAGFAVSLAVLAPAPGGPDATGRSSAAPSTAESSADIPSADAVIPPLPPGTWERLDLPDPAPGVFSTARASDVVAFGDGYVAVGAYEAHCASDRSESPQGCETALDALPALRSSVVWVSEDAMSWELLPYQPAFEGAAMRQAATDGTRIVVTGIRLDPNSRSPVAWVSENGLTWEVVEGTDLVPEQLVSTSTGFVGARATESGPQFVASEDGRSWRPLSNPGDLGPGEVMGLSVGRDGTTVVAVGAAYEYTDDGTLAAIAGSSWIARDGASWERAPANAGIEGAWMSSVTEGDAGWVAVGLDQTIETEPGDQMAAWTSPDGVAWARIDPASIAGVADGYAEHVVWTGEEFLAAGSVAGESGSTIAFWISRDGTQWDLVESPALSEGTPDRLRAGEGWAIGVGVRFAAPDHMLGVVWLASP